MTEWQNIYQVCGHVKRRQPDFEIINDDLRKSIEQNYRVLPTFEKTVFDNKYRKHYSLQSNQLLMCRWNEYKRHFEEKKITPFQFPKEGDFHFQNGNIRYLPSASINKLPEHRLTLKPGPGVDINGGMPIPNELLMKRENVYKKQENRKKRH